MRVNHISKYSNETLMPSGVTEERSMYIVYPEKIHTSETYEDGDGSFAIVIMAYRYKDGPRKSMPQAYYGCGLLTSITTAIHPSDLVLIDEEIGAKQVGENLKELASQVQEILAESDSADTMISLMGALADAVA